VARRIAIKATRDARPDLSFDELAGLFAASKRTVRDAERHDVAGWVAVLEHAPVPTKRASTLAPGQTQRVTSTPRPRASRDKAKLVPPEPEPEVEEPPADVDVPEPQFVDDENPDVDIPEPANLRDPLDDPVPRFKRRREPGDV
jgi:hypothetical protein